MSHRLERACRCSSLLMLFAIGAVGGVLCGAGSLLYLLILRRVW